MSDEVKHPVPGQLLCVKHNMNFSTLFERFKPIDSHRLCAKAGDIVIVVFNMYNGTGWGHLYPKHSWYQKNPIGILYDGRLMFTRFSNSLEII